MMMNEYFDRLLTEAVRFAELERKERDLSDEFGVAVYAAWYLTNPLKLRGRQTLDSVTLAGKLGGRRKVMRFTAHSHDCEPLHPSPDDILIYSRMNETDPGASHFLTDRLDCIKL